MSDQFLRSLDDIREEQEAVLERDLDPDMALVSDFLAGELSEEKAAEVRARIQKDPDFRDLASPLLLAAEHGARPRPLSRDDLERKWLELRRRIGLPDLSDSAPSADARIADYRQLIRKEKRAAVTRVAMAFAAMIVFAAAGPLILKWARTSAKSHVTQWGHTEIVRLTDGSSVTLSMGSRITTVRDTRLSREFMLTGEADFDIVGGGPTFLVRTQSAVVVVTGTRFTIHAYDGEPTIVSVREGTVEVRSRDANGRDGERPLAVTAGQRARLVQGYPPEIIP